MRFAEQTLRELLASAYGAFTGQALVDFVSGGGEEVLIDMIDGTTVKASNPHQLLNILSESFNWHPTL